MDIKDIGLLRYSKDVNKMKILTDYINRLPDDIKGGDQMIQMLSYIRSGDALMINESITELTWLQQHVIYALFKFLNSSNNSEDVEQKMNEILPVLIKKSAIISSGSDKD